MTVSIVVYDLYYEVHLQGTINDGRLSYMDHQNLFRGNNYNLQTEYLYSLGKINSAERIHYKAN